MYETDKPLGNSSPESIGLSGNVYEKTDLRDSWTLQFFCILTAAFILQVPRGSEISHGNISRFARMYRATMQ